MHRQKVLPSPSEVTPETPSPRSGRRPKAVAGDPREALLQAAAKLFAEQGVDATSTREICTAAGLNPGAIHYHFGDKEGLYRAVLLVPIEGISGAFAGFDDPGLSLQDALSLMLAPFLGAQNTVQEVGMRLFLNEMLRPSPVFAQTIREAIGPHHHKMARLLARHIGLSEPDNAVHQLVYGLLAMAHDYCMSRPFMELLTPGWLDAPGELEAVRTRMVIWATAMVDHERKRRGAG